MRKKEDLRVTKTYRLLFNAFSEMLTEMNFEDISVKDLCERAMIRRTTFYKHFADKYEYLSFYICQIRDDFYLCDQPAEEETTNECFIRIMRHLVVFLGDCESIVQRVLNSSARAMMLDILMERIILDVSERLREDEKNGVELPFSIDICASFYAGGFVQALRQWLQQKKPISEEEFINTIGMFLPTIEKP